MFAFGPKRPAPSVPPSPPASPRRERLREEYPGLERLDRDELDDDGRPLPLPPGVPDDLDWDDETDVSRVRRS
jgi:hypothetical protein